MPSVKSTDLTTTTVEPTESMGTSTATSPPASNTSTVTEATTEPVFPAQPPVTPFPVVRVFGTATNESQPLPADRVCDYTFYDGLYDMGPFDTLYSPHFSAPVEHVLSHASLHSVTEYGLSFAYRNASQVARDLEIPEVVNFICTAHWTALLSCCCCILGTCNYVTELQTLRSPSTGQGALQIDHRLPLLVILAAVVAAVYKH
ncbi:hypothetical protein MRX96_052848 [Rhipicephalus microplus]